MISVDARIMKDAVYTLCTENVVLEGFCRSNVVTGCILLPKGATSGKDIGVRSAMMVVFFFTAECSAEHSRCEQAPKPAKKNTVHESSDAHVSSDGGSSGEP